MFLIVGCLVVADFFAVVHLATCGTFNGLDVVLIVLLLAAHLAVGDLLVNGGDKKN